MGKLHRTTLDIFRKLQSFVPERADKIVTHTVFNNDMFPTLKCGEEVKIDTGALVTTGMIVALATDNYVDFRELQIHHGQFYLIAHNKKCPTISMEDYRALHPGAYFAGALVGSVVNSPYESVEVSVKLSDIIRMNDIISKLDNENAAIMGKTPSIENFRMKNYIQIAYDIIEKNAGNFAAEIFPEFN